MKLPFIKKPYHLKDYKFSLVILVLALSCLGVLVIGSANRPYQSRQILGLVLGIIVMVVVSLIDYIWIMNFYWILYFLSVFMLAIVLVPGIGEVVNGARRPIIRSASRIAETSGVVTTSARSAPAIAF